jgi:hypothetical protein
MSALSLSVLCSAPSCHDVLTDLSHFRAQIQSIGGPVGSDKTAPAEALPAKHIWASRPAAALTRGFGGMLP